LRHEVRAEERGELTQPRTEHQHALGPLLVEVAIDRSVAAETGDAHEQRMRLRKDAFRARRAQHAGARLFRQLADGRGGVARTEADADREASAREELRA